MVLQKTELRAISRRSVLNKSADDLYFERMTSNDLPQNRETLRLETSYVTKRIETLQKFKIENEIAIKTLREHKNQMKAYLLLMHPKFDVEEGIDIDLSEEDFTYENTSKCQQQRVNIQCISVLALYVRIQNTYENTYGF
jgi:hypothetical protein